MRTRTIFRKMRHLLMLSTFVIVLTIASQSFEQCAWTKTWKYDATPTIRNPLRGFVSYEDAYATNTFPQSLEYSYFAMKDLMNSTSTFTFSTLETYLNNVKKRKRQSILRVYLDYPNCCPDGTYNTGVPAFLFQGVNNVTLTSYTDYGGGKSPDYTNERLVSAIETLISKLGKTYDGDNRIAYIQIGLLGFWGEWHTYPKTNLMASLATRSRVLNAFDAAFNTTKLLVSQDSLQYFCPPIGNTGSNAACDVSVTSPPYPTVEHPSIGFHDDAFVDSTYSATSPKDYYFYNRLQSRIPDINKYLNPIRGGGAVMGGEVLPSWQSTLFKAGWTGQSFSDCIYRTNATWLLNDYLFTSTLGTYENSNARNSSLLLGYSFYVSQVSMCQVSPKSVTLYIAIQNRGSAPFPYANIDMVVQLKDSSNVTLSQLQFSVVNVTPDAGMQTFTKTFSWSTPAITQTPQVLLSLQSTSTYLPISFAQEDAPTDGTPLTISVYTSVNSTTPSSSPTPNTSSMNHNVTTSTGPKTSNTHTSQALSHFLFVLTLLWSCLVNF